MKSIRIGIALMLTLATLAGPAVATAAQPQAVEITVVTHIGGSGDPFQATGGVICAAGTVSQIEGRFVGGWGGRQGQLILVMRFVCPDGTFDVLLRVTLDFQTGDTAGTWSVLRGTGVYAQLHGTGSLSGDSLGGGTILDVYMGGMHVD
jgi:hypothetical protein